MASRIEVEQDFNRDLEDVCRGKVQVFYDLADQFTLGELGLEDTFRERRGCAVVYWSDGGEKELGGCCTGPQVRTVILDCYGSDRETAGRISQFVEAAICAMQPSTYQRRAIRDATLYPEQAQTYGKRLILTVQHTD